MFPHLLGPSVEYNKSLGSCSNEAKTTNKFYGQKGQVPLSPISQYAKQPKRAHFYMVSTFNQKKEAYPS